MMMVLRMRIGIIGGASMRMRRRMMSTSDAEEDGDRNSA